MCHLSTILTIRETLYRAMLEDRLDSVPQICLISIETLSHEETFA